MRLRRDRFVRINWRVTLAGARGTFLSLFDEARDRLPETSNYD